MKKLGRALLVPTLALVAALLVGALVIIFTDPVTLRAWASFTANPSHALNLSWDVASSAYIALFKGSFGSRYAISETLVNATPLLLAGLSVGLAFRAGLFNIGAEGQILAGFVGAVAVGFSWPEMPAIIHIPLALLAGAVLGAGWGFIAGFLKAKTGAHEVISTIMLNFIALSGVNYLLKFDFFLRPGRNDPISRPVADTASLPTLTSDLRVHIGILIALAVAWAVWWILFRSTIGFEFRSVGTNPNAAAYAGMSVAGTYMLVMLLAGALAGLAGATQMLGIKKFLSPGISGFGFDAIALALLGRSHPAGIVMASILFGAMRAGALTMQAATSTPIDIIVVIQALIIAFIAAPALVRAMFRVKLKHTDEGTSVLARSWGS
jgi:general nucleoside transport system permease protein